MYITLNFILGSCLQADPSPHNFNSDPLPPPPPPPTPPPIVKFNAFVNFYHKTLSDINNALDFLMDM